MKLLSICLCILMWSACLCLAQEELNKPDQGTTMSIEGTMPVSAILKDAQRKVDRRLADNLKGIRIPYSDTEYLRWLVETQDSLSKNLPPALSSTNNALRHLVLASIDRGVLLDAEVAERLKESNLHLDFISPEMVGNLNEKQLPIYLKLNFDYLSKPIKRSARMINAFQSPLVPVANRMTYPHMLLILEKNGPFDPSKQGQTLAITSMQAQKKWKGYQEFRLTKGKGKSFTEAEAEWLESQKETILDLERVLELKGHPGKWRDCSIPEEEESILAALLFFYQQFPQHFYLKELGFKAIEEQVSGFSRPELLLGIYCLRSALLEPNPWIVIID